MATLYIDSGSFNDISVTGSLDVSGNILGTASWASNVVSASFASTSSFVNTLNQTLTVTGDITASGNITAQTDLRSNFSSGDEGGQIFLNKAVTNTSITGGVNIDVYQNKLRIFENGGTNRGGYYDITALSASVGTNLLTGGSGTTFNGGTNVDNRIVTATGTTPELNGEANLSFNGSTLSVTGSVAISGSSLRLVGNELITGSLYFATASQDSNIYGVDRLYFNTIDHAATLPGELTWDVGDATLELGLSGSTGNIPSLRVGEQSIARVYNAQGATLTKGQVVYVSGSQGNRIAVKLAAATNDANSAGTLGFVLDDIANGAEGYVLTEGPLYKIDTSAYTAGALVYLSASAGAFTQTKPQAPLHEVRLGYVERVHATVGSIYVKIDNGYELDELHDVLISAPSASGDLLVRSGSVWINSKQLTGSYTLTGELAQGDLTSTPGAYSHAEGYGTIAYGLVSHTEGSNTIATTTGSHAEGRGTNAGSNYFVVYGITSGSFFLGSSFTVGGLVAPSSQILLDDSAYSNIYGKILLDVDSFVQVAGPPTDSTTVVLVDSNIQTPTASIYFIDVPFAGESGSVGDYAHAEGQYTIALGSYSHAEGYRTFTLGDYSHAEGSASWAVGLGSHAGGLHTIATKDYQTTVGQYNKLNNTVDLFVVGGGTNDANRKDVLAVSTTTIMMSGSVNITGSLLVNGTAPGGGSTVSRGFVIAMATAM